MGRSWPPDPGGASHRICKIIFLLTCVGISPLLAQDSHKVYERDTATTTFAKSTETAGTVLLQVTDHAHIPQIVKVEEPHEDALEDAHSLVEISEAAGANITKETSGLATSRRRGGKFKGKKSKGSKKSKSRRRRGAPPPSGGG